MAHRHSQTLQGTAQNDKSFLKNSLTVSRAHERFQLPGPVVTTGDTESTAHGVVFMEKNCKTPWEASLGDNEAPHHSAVRGNPVVLENICEGLCMMARLFRRYGWQRKIPATAFQPCFFMLSLMSSSSHPVKFVLFKCFDRCIRSCKHHSRGSSFMPKCMENTWKQIEQKYRGSPLLVTIH